MALLRDLAKTPERETGGKTALGRLEYQTCWGACRVIDLFQAGEDFRIGFEFHDDIVELGGQQGTEWVKFYQVKTRQKGNWTAREITKRKPGESSILGKLIAGKIKFKKFCSGTHLVANSDYSFITEGVAVSKFSDIDEESRKNLFEALKTEIGEHEFFDDCIEDLEFWKTDLPLRHYEEVLIAKLVRLVESKSAYMTYNPQAFTRMFVDQCRTRSKRYLSEFSSVVEISSGKLISRADVERWLNDLLESSKQRPRLETALMFMPASRYKQLRRYWREYELKVQDPTNLTIERERAIVRDALNLYETKDERASMADMVEDLYRSVSAKLTEERILLDEGIILTSIVYEALAADAQDERDRKIQEINSELEGEGL